MYEYCDSLQCLQVVRRVEGNVFSVLVGTYSSKLGDSLKSLKYTTITLCHLLFATITRHNTASLLLPKFASCSHGHALSLLCHFVAGLGLLLCSMQTSLVGP
jgi:hypothetical protein